MTTTTSMEMIAPSRVELIKRTVCPTGISDDEFALFIEQCKRTGLDPLTKQAFCVPRKSKVNGQWVEAHVFQPAEAGMLARAEEFPDYRGTTSGAVYEKDAIKLDPGVGTVSHSFSPVNRGKLLGAWARVEREGRTPVVRYLALEDYQQSYDGKPSGQWATRAATMIAKCAKVAALRDAFPRVFGGVYIAEEMPDDALPAPAQTRQLKAAPRDVTPPAAPATPPVLAEGELVPGDDIAEPQRMAWWNQKLHSRDPVAVTALLNKLWPAGAEQVRRAYWAVRLAEVADDAALLLARRQMADAEPQDSALRTDGTCKKLCDAARERMAAAAKKDGAA